ncbi:MAG: helix-turn-helix domain-containing protein [Candidatus Riflemargulisbacteria bacterium]
MEKLKILQISERFKDISCLPKWIISLGSWSEQIKLIREAFGMTQKQLAKRIGSTQIMVSRLENNDNNPTIETLTKTANALNCELLISFVPKTEIDIMLERLVDKKVSELVKQSVSNAAMELQKPNKKIINQSKEDLKKEIIDNKRSSLW